MKTICLITDLGQRKAALGAMVAWRDGGNIDSPQKKRVACGKQMDA